uniref:putative quinol monooxygenase n=1 Tax=Nonomuraea pusilla TaxID=46177 RepID=UPI0006E2509D|nr:antibiotic biosynthesis monooxygenase [Nonomuraea pusilla]
MEILVAVIAFAGALLAAIGAGALVRRLREEPEGWLIAWTVAAVALCLSLGAIGVGYLVGFGPVTFRLYQLTGSLLAPLWLAVGLVQLLPEKVPPKFLGWLFGIAFTVVSAAILVIDPLKSEEMGKALPSGAAHWNIFPSYLLVAVHSVAVLIMLGALVVAALKWRNGDDYDTDNLHATLVVAPSGIALVGAMRFTVPALFTTALLAVAGAAVWYTVLRPLAPYEDDEDDDDFDDEPPSRGRRAAPEPGRRHLDDARGPLSEPLGRRVAPEPVTMAAEAPPPVAPPPAPPSMPPSMPPSAPAVPPRRASGLGDLVAEYRAGDLDAQAASRMPQAADPGPATGYIMNTAPPHAPVQAPPATGAAHPGQDVFAPPQPQPGSARPSPSIYGLLTVFTIVDGSGEAFDRLAEATVEAVRRGEPDTLVYACHAVKSAPLQRIVYELYRDEVAYRDHQRQPHVERFVSERQTMVLATNVIELTVNAAKVVPLPTAMF